MYPLTIIYKDGDSGEVTNCVARSAEELNSNISGIEMDGGIVDRVLDCTKNDVRPEDIKGCIQTEAW